MKHVLSPLNIFFILLFFLTSCEPKGSSESDKIMGCLDQRSFNYNPNATVDDGNCKTMVGCLGFNGGFSNSGSTGITLNNTFYDQKMNEEVAIQRNFFNGIPANVFILYEPSPDLKNAYASTDGRILFGYHMFYYTISKFNELAAAGILAHEWGHQTQYVHNWHINNKNPDIELEADAFSGYYMALAKSYAWSQIQGYYASTYATGDYNFHSSNHHGTPNQRLAAAYLGVQTAIQAVNNNRAFSYIELHQIFTNTIKNEILNSKKTKSENVYFKISNSDLKIKKISMEKRKKLFPTLSSNW